jgi:hypothetical protein
MKQVWIRRVLLAASLLIVCISLVSLVYSLLPMPVRVDQIVLPPSLFVLPGN